MKKTCASTTQLHFLRSKRGTSYLECIIAAAAMTVAALWLWDSGNLQGAKGMWDFLVDDYKTQLVN